MLRIFRFSARVAFFILKFFRHPALKRGIGGHDKGRKGYCKNHAEYPVERRAPKEYGKDYNRRVEASLVAHNFRGEYVAFYKLDNYENTQSHGA